MTTFSLPSGEWSIKSKYGYKPKHESHYQDGTFTGVSVFEDGATVTIQDNEQEGMHISVDGSMDVDFSSRTIKVYK